MATPGPSTGRQRVPWARPAAPTAGRLGRRASCGTPAAGRPRVSGPSVATATPAKIQKVKIRCRKCRKFGGGTQGLENQRKKQPGRRPETAVGNCRKLPEIRFGRTGAPKGCDTAEKAPSRKRVRHRGKWGAGTAETPSAGRATRRASSLLAHRPCESRAEPPQPAELFFTSPVPEYSHATHLGGPTGVSADVLPVEGHARSGRDDPRQSVVIAGSASLMSANFAGVPSNDPILRSGPQGRVSKDGPSTEVQKRSICRARSG
jgi:hypothetical protein